GASVVVPSLSRLVSASTRSKSLSKSRSCTMRYFSNSLSACCFASSALTLPASCKISRSHKRRKPWRRSSQSAIVIGMRRVACDRTWSTATNLSHVEVGRDDALHLVHLGLREVVLGDHHVVAVALPLGRALPGRQTHVGLLG